ncbi:MAG: hypothetical protein ACOXZR_00310 [Bacilli bacterium]
MNFIYDVLINFSSNEVYSFYEWQEDDQIKHLKKVPLIKVDNKTYFHFKNDSIIFLDSFLKIVGASFKDPYHFLFTNGKEVCALIFNQRGEVLFKGGLLIDEEEEIINLSKDFSFKEIDYQVIKKGLFNDFLLRKIRMKRMYLKECLESVYQENNLSLLKYLYYECFHHDKEDIKVIYKMLMEEIFKEWTKKQENLYEILKLFKKKEIMSKNP